MSSVRDLERIALQTQRTLEYPSTSLRDWGKIGRTQSGVLEHIMPIAVREYLYTRFGIGGKSNAETYGIFMEQMLETRGELLGVDIGCGVGNFILNAQQKGVSWFGVDKTSYPNWFYPGTSERFFMQDLLAMEKIPSNTFHVGISCFAIPYTLETRAIESIYRIMKRGGVAFAHVVDDLCYRYGETTREREMESLVAQGCDIKYLAKDSREGVIVFCKTDALLRFPTYLTNDKAQRIFNVGFGAEIQNTKEARSEALARIEVLDGPVRRAQLEGKAPLELVARRDW